MNQTLRCAAIASLALFLGLPGSARADVLVLKDKGDVRGARFEGKLIERRDNEVVFEHVLGGVKVRSTFPKSEVLSVLEEVSLDSPAPTTREREARPHERPAAPARDHAARISGVPTDYPELEKAKHVVIVLDRARAMRVGKRFRLALEVVDSIIDHLPKGATFGVYIADQGCENVLGSNFVSPHELKRQRLRSALESFGVNPWDDANLYGALKTAFRARPDAIYLISPGVVADGDSADEVIAQFVKDVAHMRPRSKLPVHVIGIEGGVGDDDEAKASGTPVLEALASQLDGTYRELLAAAASNVTAEIHRRGGGKPKSSKKLGGDRTAMHRPDAATLAAIKQRLQAGQTLPGQGN